MRSQLQEYGSRSTDTEKQENREEQSRGGRKSSISHTGIEF